MRIGLIGLGGMGQGIAKNIVAQGFDLWVYDIDPERVAFAVSRGARACGSPLEMAKMVDVIEICVTTAEVVQDITLGPDGILAAMADNATLIDHTTVSPRHVDLMRDACDAANVTYVEAPMTRTPAHAERGEVNILFGGDEGDLERLRPLFETYAENLFHVGQAGHAIRLKLIHNYIAFANVATFCEGFALAAKEGLDMTKVIDIISAAGGKSGMMDLYGHLTLERDFTPHMSLDNAAKDVRYYAEWMNEAGLPSFMADAVHRAYELASELGFGNEGCTAVIKAYEDQTGVTAALPDFG